MTNVCLKLKRKSYFLLNLKCLNEYKFNLIDNITILLIFYRLYAKKSLILDFLML